MCIEGRQLVTALTIDMQRADCSSHRAVIHSDGTAPSSN